MKTIIMILSAAMLILAAIANANAVECVNGVHRAGCVGPNGAAGVHKSVRVQGHYAPAVAPKAVVVEPKAVAVRPPEKECAQVNGKVVCR
jgi:hypothetical protein